MNPLSPRINLSIKRSLDILISAIILVLAAPLIGFIALVIYFTMGKPIFFRQQRPGYQTRPFIINKFRTMIDERDSNDKLGCDEGRLTPLGRILRSTSLDEVPEFYNVLKGEMSLVGPRPLLMQYLDRYTVEQGRRHEVKPGITGWAQVNGRNAISWEEKFKLDVWYVDNQTIWLDMKILALTVWKIIRREGIHQPGEATAKEFKGII